MASTNRTTDAEREITTIRCLVAQQLHLIDRRDRSAPDSRAADDLLRRLLRREEDLRLRLAEAGSAAPAA